jgi:hypothetical protein
MADNNFLDEAPSSIKTQPNKELLLKEKPLSASAIKQRPAQYGQIGIATSYLSTGDNFVAQKKPHHYQLAAWDNARLKEPIIKNGMEKLVLYVAAKIGDYHHPNKMIEDFVNANINCHIKRWVAEIATSAYWSGFGVSEVLWKRKVGPKNIRQVWIDDLVNYHPTQVQFRLDDYSRLSHGNDNHYSNLKSGIWVPAPSNIIKNKKPNKSYTGGMIRLEKSKVLHIAFSGSSNNPWGVSQLNSVLDYHLFKEAFRDMMAVALDRYGTPLLYAIVPPQITNEVIAEEDGTLRNKQYRESVSEALQDVRGNQGIVLEQLSKDYPVQIGSLTTGNNFADAFKQAIDLCDANMQIGMGLPNLIMRDERSGLGSGNSAETQVEMFNLFVGQYFSLVTTAFTSQVINQLIAYNFDPYTVKDISNPGYISEVPLRPTEIQTLVKSFNMLTSLGYMNAGSQEDFNFVRSMINLPHREVDKFAKDINKVLTKQNDQQNTKEALNIKREDIQARERMNKLKVKANEKTIDKNINSSIAQPEINPIINPPIK